MVIALGKGLHPLQRLYAGAPHTWFVSQATPIAARKQWIAHHLKVQGALVLDAGAVHALRSGSSLLPVGITEVRGHFGKGDVVGLYTETGSEVGRGLTSYTASELLRIMRRPSQEIIAQLGYDGPAEAIHRDNMVVHETS